MPRRRMPPETKRVSMPRPVLARGIADARALPYMKWQHVFPWSKTDKARAARLISKMRYPLPSNTPRAAREFIQGRVAVAKEFLVRQLQDPSMTRALFNSYYSGLRKTISAELEERGWSVRARTPKYNKYALNPRRSEKAAAKLAQTPASRMRTYAQPKEPTARSELYWHSRGHLLIGKAIFADPVNFRLEEVYPKVREEIEKEKAAEAAKRKQKPSA